MTRRSYRHDGGFIPLEMVLAITCLLLPVTLMVIAFPTWVERQAAASAAAADAARAASLSNTWAQAQTAAETSAARTARGAGLDADDIELGLHGDLRRGGAITATARVSMPALVLPLMGSFGSWSGTASHTERVDDFRSFG
jgi:Flp pilus assembly protein TadG